MATARRPRRSGPASARRAAVTRRRLGVGAALVGGRIVAGDCSVHDGRIDRAGLVARRAGATGIAAPGFVDLQVNGFAGADFLSAGVTEEALEALRATGVAALLPTFVTAPEAAVADALRALPDHPLVAGAHLEGPFLSPARLGAHPAAHRRDPDLALLERLLEAGPVRHVTLAPELPGAGGLVDALARRGVTVAAGHTDATAGQAHAAFDRGVRAVTHLFNAMRPPSARDPGIAFAALGRRDVAVTVIADRVHLADDTLRTVFAAAPGRVALVTDATAAAAAPDGGYRLGRLAIRARGGVVRDETGRLAGSALTMDAAVRNVCALGVPLPVALAAASAVPARIAGLGEVRGVVVLDDRLEVAATA